MLACQHAKLRWLILYLLCISLLALVSHCEPCCEHVSSTASQSISVGISVDS